MKFDDKPWANKPFELIIHAEIHFQRGDDYDKRLALISFDNSVERVYNGSVYPDGDGKYSVVKFSNISTEGKINYFHLSKSGK